MIGTFTAAGVPPWFMVAHSAGETFEGLVGPDGRPAEEADRSGGAVFRLHRGIPRIGPSSLRMAATTMRHPLRHTPLQLITGWLPAGVISTEHLEEVVGRAVPGDWVDHPSFWVVCTDTRTGKRVAFGREDAPEAPIGKAVAASCAIPGFYRPVRIGDCRYVDGGVCSASNLDLLKGEGLDLVICLNPTSSRAGVSARTPAALMAGRARVLAGRRLGREAKKLRAAGTELLLIQPEAEDLEVMGSNLMSGRRRHEMIETAIETVGRQLEHPEARELLQDLPQGEPHKLRRPDGPPAAWPPIVSAPAQRQAA
jgi:NTE family protein